MYAIRSYYAEHGVHQVFVPWAESGSGFTALFEALCISWLKVATINAVAERMKVSWDEAWGIMERAVRRGLARREDLPVKELAIDETAFQKHHEYVTVLVNRETGAVLEVLDDRKKATLKTWLNSNKQSLKEVRSVSVDMWKPFINAVKDRITSYNVCYTKLLRKLFTRTSPRTPWAPFRTPTTINLFSAVSLIPPV